MSGARLSLGGSIRGSLASGGEGGDAVISRFLHGKAPEILLSGESILLPGNVVSLMVESNLGLRAWKGNTPLLLAVAWVDTAAHGVASMLLGTTLRKVSPGRCEVGGRR